MANTDRGVSLARLAAALPIALLGFVAAAFVLPTGPAYLLVFYALVLPLTLACLPHLRMLRALGPVLGMLLILWSALTLIWGTDIGHRSLRFAVDSAMTLAFLAAMVGGLGEEKQRANLASVLIYAGAANAALSIGLGMMLSHQSERLHGWGATSHPILGASVMGVAYLTALCRGLTAPRRRVAALAASGLMAAFILETESRGPLLAVSAATLFLCVAGPWRWRALGALVALGAAWRLLPSGLRAHHAEVLVARGSSHRFEIWHRTLEMIGQRPLFGHGLADNLDLPGITFPHDLYLSVLFYSGIVGLALFTALCGWVSLALWRGRRAGAWPRADWLWMVAIWTSALLSGLTDLGQITKGPGPLWFIFWLPVGLVLAAPWAARSAGAQQPGAVRGEPGRGAGAVGGERVA